MSTKQGNPANYLRLSGMAIFFPANAAPGIHLGNITMHKKVVTQEVKEHFKSQAGKLIRDRIDVTKLSGEYEIEVDEVHTANLPLLLFSAPATIVTQALIAAPVGTAALNDIVLDATYDIGKRKLNTVVVKRAATTLDGDGDNRDYTLDADSGMITFHGGGANGLVGGVDDIAITYGCPLLARESYAPFTIAQRAGTVKLFETDDLPDSGGTGFRVEKTIPCTLRADGTEEYKVDDYAKWTLKATITGPTTELREARALAGF